MTQLQPLTAPALEVEGLGVTFGSVRAVDGVSFTVQGSTIVGLIGPNGAGKTTIFDAISGLVPSRGSVYLAGSEISSLPPYRRARRGLGRSFQDGRMFSSLTVRENLAVGLESQVDHVDPLSAVVRVGLASRVEREIARRVEELIELLGLGSYANKFVGELSTGTRRIVDIAAVLAHRPRVLLLDEPSSGIAQRETEQMGPLFLRIRDALQCAVLLIEHDMPLVTAVSDELIALETGAIIARGLPAAVTNHPRVVESYLGVDQEVIRRSEHTVPELEVVVPQRAPVGAGGHRVSWRRRLADLGVARLALRSRRLGMTGATAAAALLVGATWGLGTLGSKAVLSSGFSVPGDAVSTASPTAAPAEASPSPAAPAAPAVIPPAVIPPAVTGPSAPPVPTVPEPAVSALPTESPAPTAGPSPSPSPSPSPTPSPTPSPCPIPAPVPVPVLCP